MPSTRYLSAGAGMPGDRGARGTRGPAGDGAAALAGPEPHPPYKRPPLTKGLWSGGDEAKIWRGTEDAGVDVRLGRRVVSVDPAERLAIGSITCLLVPRALEAPAAPAAGASQ